MVEKTKHAQRTSCPIACALDVLGDHWSLLIVRNLMFKNIREYKDMLACAENIASNMLSDRLKKLELAGVVASVPHEQSKLRKLYYLTPKGKSLIHMLTELIIWSADTFPDVVLIPEEQKKMLKQNPKAFIAQTLRQLEMWESQHVHQKQSLSR